MARRNRVDILIAARDEATRPLQAVRAEVNKLGPAARQAATETTRAAGAQRQQTRTSSEQARALQGVTRELRTATAEHRAGVTSSEAYRAALERQERELRELVATLDRTSGEYEEAVHALAQVRGEVDRLTPELDQATEAAREHGQVTSRGFSLIESSLNALVTGEALRRWLSFLADSASLAHEARAAEALFAKQLQRTGQDIDAGADAVERLSDRFGVAETVVQRAATILLRQGAELGDIEDLITAAAASAAAANFDLATAVDNVATAVATGRSELLETSGIVTNLGPVTQQYAASIGKTVDELTQSEIMHARINAILRETQSEVDDVDLLLQGLPRAQAEVRRQWHDLRVELGELTERALEPLLEMLAELLRFMNELPAPVRDFGVAAGTAALGVIALGNAAKALRVALIALRAPALATFGPLGWAALAVGVVAGLAAALSGRRDSLDSAVEDARAALAGGDANSLVGALGEVAESIDDPVRERILALQNDLIATGEIGEEAARRVEQALDDVERAKNAAEIAALQAERRGLVEARDRLLEGRAASELSIPDLQAQLRTVDLELTNLQARVFAGERGPDLAAQITALNETRQTLLGLLAAAQTAAEGAEATEAAILDLNTRIADLDTRLAELGAAIERPGRDTAAAAGGAAGGGEPTRDPIAERLSELDAELAALQREATLGLATAADVNERTASLLEDAARDLIRLGASDEQIRGVLERLPQAMDAATRGRAIAAEALGPSRGMATGMTPDEVRRALIDSPAFQRAQDEALEAWREYARGVRDAARDAERAGREISGPTAGMATGLTPEEIRRALIDSPAARRARLEAQAAWREYAQAVRGAAFAAERLGREISGPTAGMATGLTPEEIRAALEAARERAFQEFLREMRRPSRRAEMRRAEVGGPSRGMATGMTPDEVRRALIDSPAFQRAQDEALGAWREYEFGVRTAAFAAEQLGAEILGPSAGMDTGMTPAELRNALAQALQRQLEREEQELREFGNAVTLRAFTAQQQGVEIGGPSAGMDTGMTPEEVRAALEAAANREETQAEEAARARADVVNELTTMSAEKGALANFGAALLNVASQEVPAFGAALDGFVQAGVVGGVINGLLQLATGTEAFQDLIAMVNAALEPLSVALGAVIEALLPVVQPVLELIAAIASIAHVIAKVLAPPLELLGRVVSFVVDIFVAVWNFLFGWLGLGIERPNLTPPEEQQESPPVAPTPDRVFSDRPPAAPEPQVGNLAPALQFGLATPLRLAADTMLQAAELQLAAAENLAGGRDPLAVQDRFATSVDAFGFHVDRFGAYIELLVEEGVGVHDDSSPLDPIVQAMTGHRYADTPMGRTAVYR